MPVGTVTQWVTELLILVTPEFSIQGDGFHNRSSCFGLKWESEV